MKEIAFGIHQGQILGLIGESGSGKSVASQCLTRLIDDANLTGEVLFSHKDTLVDLLTADEATLREIRKHEIAYIFQEPMTALNPLIPCGKQILECSTAQSPEILSELLEKVELTDTKRVAASYPHELSGGQRQRIMIAMALAKKPKLLIADEPTTALDIAVQTGILALLKKLSREENMGILFITHDLGVIAQTADQVAVMYLGKLIEKGSVRQVLRNPGHPYTRGLLEALPRLDDLDRPLKPVKGDIPSPLDRPSGCVFNTRCPVSLGSECETIIPEFTTNKDGQQVACILAEKEAQKEEAEA